MNFTPRTALDLCLCRFEFQIVLACLLACAVNVGLEVEAQSQNLSSDRQALVALYNATDGANWEHNHNWLSDEPLRDWYGVTASDGRVTTLDLRGNQLTGPIPAELGNLDNLTWLALFDNQLTGAIPSWLGDLSNLEVLYLNDNQLTGPIPPELGTLSHLTDLHLYNNELTGPIPPELGNLASLETLSLSSNQLTGTIPAELGNLANLTWLALHNNKLTGAIPAKLGAFTNLVVLSLADNQLTGAIPAGLGNLSSLQLLYLHSNKLTGSIPSWLGNLSRLQELYLHDNKLTGTLPISFTRLGALTSFYFDLNAGLCAQDESDIRTWLDGVDDVSGPDCSSDETAKRSHFLPHMADGGGWQSTLLVTNVAQSASQCTLQLHGLNADRFHYGDAVRVSGSTATFDLPGAGTFLAWPTRNQHRNVASGYATLDCTEPVVAQVVFASIGSSGTPTGMATVFSSQAGTVFQLPVLTPEATLGFAIANDTDTAAGCRIVLEDPLRTNRGQARIAVPSKSNWAGRLLDQIIPVPSTFRFGTATVSCDQPVAMIGLHYELQPDRTITTFRTLPPAVIVPFSGASDETAKRSHFLPHIADGGGWQSMLLVTGVVQSASQCTLQLHGLNADRFHYGDAVRVSGSTATFDLPGAGTFLAWPTRNQHRNVASGYATLDCTEPVVAQVVFASIGSSGTPTGMATVFSSQAGTVFQLPVLTPEATLGFAIANDTDTAAGCRIVLEDPLRTNRGQARIAVPSKSNWAGRLLDQIIPVPSTFRFGTATVSCDQPVAMIGLHYELQPDRTVITFSTLTPAVLESPQYRNWER